MESYWWFVILIVLLVMAVPVVQFVTGLLVPVGNAGRFLLSAELKKWGIRQHIPDACVFDIADKVSELFREMGERNGQGAMWAKQEMVPDIQRDARVILEWARGRDIAGESIRYVPEALKRHGVPLGCAKPAPAGRSCQ